MSKFNSASLPLKMAAISGAILIAVGCTHRHNIVGYGTITGPDGLSCETSEAPCDVLVEGAYNATYTATPASGWEFSRWAGCIPPRNATGTSCTFDIPAGGVAQNVGTRWGSRVEFVESAPQAPDASPSFVSCSAGVCTLTGQIDQDYTLTRGTEWRLNGEVIVGNGNVLITSIAQANDIAANGVTLEIQSGVEVKAFDTGSLIVTRGSKLEARGTAESPITFSSLDDGYDGLGEWGGVVLQGFAPQFGPGNTGACFSGLPYCNVAGEGGTIVGRYGGNNPADDSGTFRYVRIAEGGLIAGPNNEINGLTLQGVGHGTIVEYVQVHDNLDDGVEWFGGTANARYLVLTGNDDDDIDFDEGYKGNVQYAIVRKNPDRPAPQGSNDPRAVEANSSDDEYVPQTQGALANLTLVGAAVSSGEPAMRLRGALTGRVYNTAITGWARSCVRIDDADTDGTGNNIVATNVNLINVKGDCGVYFDGSSSGSANTVANSGALSPLALDAAWAMSAAQGNLNNAPSIGEINNGSGFVFDDTNFIGAVAPGTAAADAWYAGWIIPGSL